MKKKKRRTGVHPCTRPQILDYVRRAGGGTRATLAKDLGATSATVSRQVRRLLKEGFLVREGGGGKGKGGRVPEKLSLNPEAGRIVGIDVRPREIHGTLCDFTAQIRAKRARRVPKPEVKAYLTAINRVIGDLLAKADGQRVFGIGIGTAGPVSQDCEIALSLPHCPAWRDVPLRRIVEEKFDMRTRIDDGSNVGPLAYHWLKGRETHGGLIGIDLRYGIGSGIVIGGEIWRGTNGTAGEIGHVVIDPHGPKCYCGHRGCVEQMVLGELPLTKALERKERSPESALFRGGGPRSALEIYECAAGGDILAEQIATECVEHLAAALGTFVTIFDPADVIVLSESESIIKVLQQCLQPLSQSHAYPPSFRSARFAVERVDDFFFAKAAAVLVLRERFGRGKYPGVRSQESGGGEAGGERPEA